MDQLGCLTDGFVPSTGRGGRPGSGHRLGEGRVLSVLLRRRRPAGDGPRARLAGLADLVEERGGAERQCALTPPVAAAGQEERGAGRRHVGQPSFLGFIAGGAGGTELRQRLSAQVRQDREVTGIAPEAEREQPRVFCPLRAGSRLSREDLGPVPGGHARHDHSWPLQALGRVDGGQSNRVAVADMAGFQTELLLLGRRQVGEEGTERGLLLIPGEARGRVRERVEIGAGAGRVPPGPGRHLDIQPEHPLNLAHQVGQWPPRVPTERPQFRGQLSEAGVADVRVRSGLAQVVKRLHQAARIGGEVRHRPRESIIWLA